MLAPGQRANAKSVHQHRPFVELTRTKWCLAHKPRAQQLVSPCEVRDAHLL